MHYTEPSLVLTDDRVEYSRGVITLDDLAPDTAACLLRVTDSTPMIERLWRVALSDCERNIVHTDDGDTYFGAGAAFGVMVFTRDISYSGVLGLNRVYPDIMRRSIEFTRKLRLKMGFTMDPGHDLSPLGIDCIIRHDLDHTSFRQEYHTNCYARRTDDVVWLWATSDLLAEDGSDDDWRWVYETGNRCFAELYEPFYDKADGLYRGQASFIDIHFPHKSATGYPQDWSVCDCLAIKTTSTNALYGKGLDVMASAAARLGLQDEAADWAARRDRLRAAMRETLRNEDGTFAMYLAPDGTLAPRQEALGTALAVLLDVVTGDDAAATIRDYPLSDRGVPLFEPFYDDIETVYHNGASWPFVETFFLMAREKALGINEKPRSAALLARTCVEDGTFHEVVQYSTGKPGWSGSQLWTAAGFIGLCYRAGLTIQ